MDKPIITSVLPYKVGGGLRFNHPTYIRRQADQQLYDSLIAGEFCYIFDSRQMGKSSLRVQTMHRLQLSGVVSVSVDLTTIGSEVVMAEQWYRGVFVELMRKFHFTDQTELGCWWDEASAISPIQRLNQFIQEVVLQRITDRAIVICFDEIDSVLGLSFATDDFFAWIRSCYNQRAENPNYNRLTFALFGVATPPDLMRDKKRTPFNIGRAIKLSGFEWQEAQPLAEGLTGYVERPMEVLHSILTWTGGQPFLTQKLCQLVVLSGQPIPTGQEDEAVEQCVRSRILHNWELEDDPEHLRTIRDFLLRDPQTAGRLLGLYQQILMAAKTSELEEAAEAWTGTRRNSSGIQVDDSVEQMQLLLSGLVVRQNSQLRVRNRIYCEIFDLRWVQGQLSKLRPYSEALEAWVRSGYEDESRLLHKQALLDAQQWAIGKRLSDLDYQFLAASQLLDRRLVQNELEMVEQTNRILADAQERANRVIHRGMVGLTALSILAVGLLGLASVLSRQAMLEKRQAILSQIHAAVTTSQVMLVSDRPLEALLYALKAAGELRQLGSEKRPELREQVQTTLQESINFVTEINRLEGHSGGVKQVCFSPNGEWIATASEDQTVRIWNRHGQLLKTLTGHQGEVNSATISPDSRTIASASADGTVKLWDGNGKLLRTIPVQQGQVYDVSFSPDGQRLAIATAQSTVTVWNMQGQRLQELKGHQGAVYSVDFSADGRAIATASADGTIKLWSEDGQLVRSLTGHQGEVRDVSFSPKGNILASAGEDETVRIWNRQGALLHTLTGHTNWVYGVGFSPDGKTLVSASADMTVKLWHSDGHLLRTLTGHSDDVYAIAFSPDSQVLATASLDNTVKLWNPFQTPTTVLRGHTDWVSTAIFSPDGQTVATSSLDKTARIWQRDGHLLHILKGHTGKIYGIAFSPDGQTLATSSGDRTVRLWNRNGNLVRTLTGFRDWVGMVQFSPDGQLLGATGGDRTLTLWNRDGRLIRTLKGHDDWIYDLDFSPNSQLIATVGEDKTAIIWSRDGRLLHRLKGHSAQTFGVSFTPDGRSLATASGDGTVKLWSVEGTLLQTITVSDRAVLVVTFSPDGRKMATGGEDGIIRLWTRDGQLLNTLKGHTNGIWGIAFSPDGQRLITGSQDNTAIIWDLNKVGSLDTLVQQGCHWVQDYVESHQNGEEGDRENSDVETRLVDSLQYCL